MSFSLLTVRPNSVLVQKSLYTFPLHFLNLLNRKKLITSLNEIAFLLFLISKNNHDRYASEVRKFVLLNKRSCREELRWGDINRVS